MNKKKLYRLGLHFFSSHREREEKEFVELIESCRLPPKATVLEIGVGTGRFISLVKKNFAGFSCFGIDVVSDFVNVPHKNIALSLQSAEKLSFENGFFDLVFCIDALHHVPDRLAALGEIARVVKRNGTVIFRDIRPRHSLDKLFYRIVDLSCFAYNPNMPQYFSETEWETQLAKYRIPIETIRQFDSQLDWIVCRKK